MKKFDEWMIINEEKGSSNKTKAIVEFVDSIKEVFKKLDLATRKKVWQEITSAKGKELVEKLIKNPKTYLSDSEFIKLVQRTNK
jgi:ribosomal protein L17